MHQFGNNFLAHERLAIIDPASGDQPLFNEDKTIVVTVNGEIYNHLALKEQILEKAPGKKFATQSDCEVSTWPRSRPARLRPAARAGARGRARCWARGRARC
jgi:hypothetical protein